MCSSNLGSCRTITKHCSYTFVTICCYRHTDACSAYQYSSLSFSIQDFVTSTLCIIWKIILFINFCRSDIKDCVSCIFEKMSHRSSKDKTSMIKSENYGRHKRMIICSRVWSKEIKSSFYDFIFWKYAISSMIKVHENTHNHTPHRDGWYLHKMVGTHRVSRHITYWELALIDTREKYGYCLWYTSPLYQYHHTLYPHRNALLYNQIMEGNTWARKNMIHTYLHRMSPQCTWASNIWFCHWFYQYSVFCCL